MAKSIALVDGKVGNFVKLPDGRWLRITSREELTDQLRSGSGITECFYQLDPAKDDRYLEVTSGHSGVMEVRLTTGAPPPPDSDRDLDEMLTLVYEGKHLLRANAGLGRLIINGRSEGRVRWVRFYSAGQREPGTKVVTVAQQVNDGGITHYGGVILDKNAVHITES